MNAPVFTPYQKFVIAMLAFLQFTLVLDFMIMSPLGALLMPDLHISTRQFGLVVSAYAFSAGAAGIMAAGFADKFDRKRLLLFFYAGFVLGTFLCGIANTYAFLLAARIVTGLFGGVIGSVSMAIIADLFPMQVRGRVMGFVQTAFAASQVLGLPLGLFLSNRWNWHAPFLMIVGVSAVVGILIAFKLKPINEHLKIPSTRNPFVHLYKTVSQGRYIQGFAATMLLATGGFMLMPFGSAFSVGNLGISMQQLPWVYLGTGIASFIAGPFMGKLSDKLGKYKMFSIGSTLGIAVVLLYCNLGITPLAWVIVVNIVLFTAVTARMIASQSLMSGVPDMPDRGAFMAVNNSVAQFAGGVAASIAGLIVVQTPNGHMEHYGVLGWVVAGAMAATILLMYPIHKMVTQKMASQGGQPAGPGAGSGVPQPAAAAK
ncbi:MAG: major facilitator superfamily 1 [Fibrobacteres bacterium]|nr:major facilitator superfamily 1 [Fibrobacterota bacterium]